MSKVEFAHIQINSSDDAYTSNDLNLNLLIFTSVFLRFHFGFSRHNERLQRINHWKWKLIVQDITSYSIVTFTIAYVCPWFVGWTIFADFSNRCSSFLVNKDNRGHEAVGKVNSNLWCVQSSLVFPHCECNEKFLQSGRTVFVLELNWCPSICLAKKNGTYWQSCQ